MPVQRRDPPKAPRAARARDDPQSSLTLLASVIASGFENDGQDIPVAGQSSSLTSTNNYINFCGTTSLPITNGTQVRTGFCNPAPMGVLPGITNMPSSKFTYPRNGDILAPNAPMTVGLSVTKLATGNFADASTAYLSAPQQLTNGQIDGHAFIIIEQLSSPSQITPTDPLNFAFFKGLNQQAQDGVLTANVVGLPTGFYRMSSIITATNHQPALVPVMQHGLLDDVIYVGPLIFSPGHCSHLCCQFTLVQGGALPTNQTGITQPADAATSVSYLEMISFGISRL
ncbi:hypothetical protein B0H10DRAFT_1787164 [Mycena sp. CBHHK59/15]|nr:hypothetical protein B0H10DRAFT_1787164 [Mycena sp. CBHHK59/15]